MDRLLLVSADCHAAARPDDYRPYLERRHLAAYEEWLPRMRRGDVSERELHAAHFGARTVAAHHDADAVLAGGADGYWDFSRRLRELEADGVAAEVIFPNPANVPFDAFPLHMGDPELQLAGARAYNRWLADRIDRASGRQAGIALVTLDDVDAAAAEVRRCAEAGLRGVILPTRLHGHPLYNHPRYEPLWTACEETGLPVHTHALQSAHVVPGPGGDAIGMHETLWHTQRPLWCMIFGGVFERHPGLRFVVTEAGVEWIPELLERMDIAHTGHPTQKFTEHLELQPMLRGRLAPSEIWRRSCWAGASFMPKAEARMRHRIGVDRLMWGSDYPHIEGTWPHTRAWLKDAFSGVDRAEAQRMLGENAVACYGFDAARLAAVAARVGPRFEDLAA
jgi:predicted TIM-barrel fold metal-dependent hydrolase